MTRNLAIILALGAADLSKAPPIGPLSPAGKPGAQ